MSVKLKYLDEWNARRSVLAKSYTLKLSNSNLVLPFVPEWAEPVWHQYVVRSKERDYLHRKLEHAGISTMIHYPIPPHRQQAYVELDQSIGSFPIAERIANDILSLPIDPHLKMAKQDQVANEMMRILSSAV